MAKVIRLERLIELGWKLELWNDRYVYKMTAPNGDVYAADTPDELCEDIGNGDTL